MSYPYIYDLGSNYLLPNLGRLERSPKIFSKRHYFDFKSEPEVAAILVWALSLNSIIRDAYTLNGNET